MQFKFRSRICTPLRIILHRNDLFVKTILKMSIKGEPIPIEEVIAYTCVIGAMTSGTRTVDLPLP